MMRSSVTGNDLLYTILALGFSSLASLIYPIHPITPPLPSPKRATAVIAAFLLN